MGRRRGGELITIAVLTRMANVSKVIRSAICIVARFGEERSGGSRRSGIILSLLSVDRDVLTSQCSGLVEISNTTL